MKSTRRAERTCFASVVESLMPAALGVQVARFREDPRVVAALAGRRALQRGME